MSSKLQILLTIIPSFVLFLNSSKIGNKFGLIDFPDNKRKIHKSMGARCYKCSFPRQAGVYRVGATSHSKIYNIVKI